MLKKKVRCWLSLRLTRFLLTIVTSGLLRVVQKFHIGWMLTIFEAAKGLGDFFPLKMTHHLRRLLLQLFNENQGYFSSGKTKWFSFL